MVLTSMVTYGYRLPLSGRAAEKLFSTRSGTCIAHWVAVPRDQLQVLIERT